MEGAWSALPVAYGDLQRLVSSVREEEAWQPTGCRGWAVRDLVLHLLGDAQRALVALGTPADGPPDRDAVSYWSDSPPVDDPEFREVRAVRTLASTYSLQALKRDFGETSRAVVVLAARADPSACVVTQGYTLLAEDLVATLVVEAAVHHLDLVTHLDRPGPRPEPLAMVRRTLDGLLGHPVTVGWDDAAYAWAGTGRRALTAEETAALGEDAARLPLL